MKAHALTLVSALLVTAAAGGCDKKGDSSADAGPEKSEAEKAAEKKEALLRASGIDPTTVKGIDAGPTPSQPSGSPQAPTAPAALGAPADSASDSASASAATGTQVPTGANGEGPTISPDAPQPAKIELISAGSGPKQKLAYVFEKGRKRKFSMEMTVSQNKTINGQPMPATPAETIGVTGTSETVAFAGGLAERQNTFEKFNPSAQGAPPELLEQMKAQFQSLNGIQLIELVSTNGQIREIRLPPALAGNPQVVAILQTLQDGMTKAYTHLPSEPVGVGAKWKATEQAPAPGALVTQVNEVTLKSINGSELKLDVKLDHKAKPQAAAPGLPVQVTGMTGTGSGEMTVDLKTLATNNTVNINITMDTKITQPGQPQAVMATSDTKMKIHLKVSK